MKKCHVCVKVLEIRMPVGRRETCPFCGTDLHACLNCAFHETTAYNECREPQAERVIDKGRSNFCDFFVFRDAGAVDQEQGPVSSAKARLDSLFKAG
jgi:hypothetical protein